MTPLTVTAGTNPYAVTVDPTGKFVYVANNGSTNISQYTIGAGGVLSPMTTATAGAKPVSITTTGAWQ
jgi:DNA-binding beta-propeller fold protein YncE